MDAERVGREFVVSAWLEPQNAKSAGVRCGAQGTFAAGIIETSPDWPGGRRRLGRAFGFPGRKLGVIGVPQGGMDCAIGDLRCERNVRPGRHALAVSMR